MLHESFERHQAVVEASVPVIMPALEAALACSVDRLQAGSKVLVLGNGGSAAQAQHFAAEITGRFQLDRPAWPAVALSADTVAITAVANDYGFDHVFARQIEALARPGDVVVAISTSGRSANVLAAAEAAQRAGCHVIGLCGLGGDMAECSDVLIEVPSSDVARVQEVHGICLHAWAASLEAILVSAPVGEVGV